jgi:erythronate-4-phosphate dehydrogenase
MRILCDDAVFAADTLLAPLAGSDELQLAPGRQIGSMRLDEVEVLVTRTVTRVDAELLERAPKLAMVASASAGVDHVDVELLARRGLHFAHAPGCNALAVAQWVAAAWLRLLEAPRQAHRRDARVGVIGHGQVGRRVADLFHLLGHDTLHCDPPRARESEEARANYRSLEELLESCDLLTLHTPLTDAAPDATRALLTRASVESFLGRGGVIINTSRGEVLELPERVPESAAMILDVWPGEPHLPWSWLVREAARGRLLATPHVAGYSAEAKLRGTQAVAEAVAAFSGHISYVSPPVELPRARQGVGTLHGVTRLEEDHRSLLAVAAGSDRDAAFTALRRGYAYRREFLAYARHFEAGASLAAHAPLLALD